MRRLINNVSIELLFFLVLPFYVSLEIFFIFSLIYLFCNFVFFKIKITKKVSFILIIFFILLYIGTINSIGKNYSIKDIIRDIVNFSIPIFSILLGYIIILKKNNKNKILNTFIVLGTFLSLVHLINILSCFSNGISLNSLRSEAGNGNMITVIALIILLNNTKYKLEILNNKKIICKICLFVNLFSFILSLSRTLILVFSVMFLFINFDLKKVNRKFKLNFLELSFCWFIVLIIIPIIIYFVSKNSIFIELINKLKNSFTEMSPNNTWDWNSINNNWRGYEAYRAQILYNNSELINKLIGNGFGTRVYLNLKMRLGEEFFTTIPILHNGYMYILVKSGVLGVLLYISSFIILIINGVNICKNKVEDKFIGKVSIAIAISIIILTTFSTGALGYSYSSLNIIIGLIFGKRIIEKYRRKEKCQI